MMGTEITENSVRRMIDERNSLDTLIKQRFDFIYRLRSEWKKALLDYPTLQEINITSEEVSILGESVACHRGCCGLESHSYTFPVKYLWWTKEQVKAEIEEIDEQIRLDKEDKKCKAAEEKARIQKKAEQDLLTRLKEKYPEGGATK